MPMMVESELNKLHCNRLKRCMYFRNPHQRGHVNIGIIFLCIGNSKGCLYNTQTKSEWLFITQARILPLGGLDQNPPIVSAIFEPVQGFFISCTCYEIMSYELSSHIYIIFNVYYQSCVEVCHNVIHSLAGRIIDLKSN